MSLLVVGQEQYIMEFVEKCVNSQQIKYEHQRHASLLQRKPIP